MTCDWVHFNAVTNTATSQDSQPYLLIETVMTWIMHWHIYLKANGHKWQIIWLTIYNLISEHRLWCLDALHWQTLQRAPTLAFVQNILPWVHISEQHCGFWSKFSNFFGKDPTQPRLQVLHLYWLKRTISLIWMRRFVSPEILGRAFRLLHCSNPSQNSSSEIQVLKCTDV